MIQYCEINASEIIFGFPAGIIKFFYGSAEQIRNNMCIISKSSASPCSQNQHLIAKMCRNGQHTTHTLTHHILIFLFRTSFHPISQHRSRTGHNRHRHTFFQKLSVLIPDNFHLRRDHQCIRPHVSMQCFVVIVIFCRLLCFQSKEQ